MTEKGLDEATQKAMSDFLGDVESRAFRMAQIATGSRDDALDIVQDAMIRLVNKYADKDRDHWKPLFYRILNNRINDYHRRAKTRRLLLGWIGSDSGEEQQDDYEGVADTLETDEQLKARRAIVAMDQAIRALPQRQQQAVMLRLWEGLDVADTAQAMGCTEGSVKTHYSRAIAKLRETLGEHWP